MPDGLGVRPKARPPAAVPRPTAAAELVEELNNDKDVELMILTDTKVGDVYKERINVLLLFINLL